MLSDLPGRLPPPPDIVRSAYAELVVTDLARARWFWVDVLGFVVTESGPGALYLRGYDELTHHNLIQTEGAEPAASRLAFRVRTPADLDRAVDFYGQLGCRTARMPAGTTPRVGVAVRAEDPLGFTVEFFHDSTPAGRLQQRYDLRRGAEVVEIYTSDYYTGDPDHPVLRWDVSDPRRRDFYGHAVVPSWYTEATTVLDLGGNPRPATEPDQVLESAVGADGFRIR